MVPWWPVPKASAASISMPMRVWHAGAVVRAMDDKTSGPHRRKAGEAFRHPVDVCDGLECQGPRGGFTGGEGDQRAHRRAVGRCTEMNCHLPLAAVAPERRAHRAVGIEMLAERGGEAAHRLSSHARRATVIVFIPVPLLILNGAVKSRELAALSIGPARGDG